MRHRTARLRRHPRRLGLVGLAAVAVAGFVGLGSGVNVVGARSQRPLPKVVATERVCNDRPVPTKPPENLPQAPDTSLLAILGVLRRPQVPADIPPAAGVLDPFLEGVEVGYERLLTTTARGARYFLIPGYVVPPSPPRNCTPPLSAKELHRQQALDQRLRLHPRFTLLVTAVAANGLPTGGSGGASSAAAIMAGVGTSGGFGTVGATGGYATEVATIDGLVPDGVASVTLHYRHRIDRTLAVSNNFFVLTVTARIRAPKVRLGPHGLPVPPLAPAPFPPSKGPAGVIAPIAIVWHDASGAVIKTVRQPAYCATEHGAAQRRCFLALAKVP